MRDDATVTVHSPEPAAADGQREHDTDDRQDDEAPGHVVLTMFDDDDSVFEAMRAGAGGYVVKSAEKEEIGRAIRAVASGEAIFGPGIAQRVLRYFATPAPTAEPFPELTPREREILNLLAAAMPNSMIATRLGLSPKTVANHLSSIFTKLQVADRAQEVGELEGAIRAERAKASGAINSDRVPRRAEAERADTLYRLRVSPLHRLVSVSKCYSPLRR